MRLLALSIAIAVVLAVAGLYAVYAWVPAASVAGIDDAAGGYLQTVGTIYAVLLAFVVFVVWQQYDGACGHINREANDLLDLYRLVQALPEPVRGAALAAVRAYTDAILGEEWEDMQHGRECGRALGHLDQLWQAMQGFEPQGARQEALYGEALGHFSDLSDARAERLRSSRQRIPMILWLLLLSGAVVVVGSMYLFTLRRFLPHAIMTAALAGAITHVLIVIYDLDTCFTGYWQVSPEPFRRVRKFMKEETQT